MCVCVRVSMYVWDQQKIAINSQFLMLGKLNKTKLKIQWVLASKNDKEVQGGFEQAIHYISVRHVCVSPPKVWVLWDVTEGMTGKE